MFDHEGQSFLIETGKNVIVPLYTFHHNSEYLSDPETFNPERFRDDNMKNHVAYMPFGLAPKDCIGFRFALLEMKTIIYHLLTIFRFERCEKTEIPLKLVNKPVSLQVENGVWFRLVVR